MVVVVAAVVVVVVVVGGGAGGGRAAVVAVLLVVCEFTMGYIATVLYVLQCMYTFSMRAPAQQKLFGLPLLSPCNIL
jgi:hypothetical protein